MKTNLRVVTLVMVMGAVGTCVSVAAAQSARRELSPGQGARTFPSAILKYREDLNRNTVTIIQSKNGNPLTNPINRTVQALLKERAKARPVQTNLVFFSPEHSAIDDDYLRRVFT